MKNKQEHCKTKPQMQVIYHFYGMHLRQKLFLQKIQGNITHRNENLEKKYIWRAGQLNFMHRKFKPKRSGKQREMKPSSRSFIHSIICGKTFPTLKCMCIMASFRCAYFVLFPYQATNMKCIFSQLFCIRLWHCSIDFYGDSEFRISGFQ